jgi:hypothetical protein
MRKLFFSIIISSFVFCGNLEVEGGITATGEVQSPTIQALLDQITQLQNQINILQMTSLNHKVASVSFNGDSNTNLSQLFPGISFNWAILSITNCVNDSEGRCHLYANNPSSENDGLIFHNLSNYDSWGWPHSSESSGFILMHNINQDIGFHYDFYDSDEGSSATDVDLLLIYK